MTATVLGLGTHHHQDLFASSSGCLGTLVGDAAEAGAGAGAGAGALAAPVEWNRCAPPREYDAYSARCRDNECDIDTCDIDLEPTDSTSAGEHLRASSTDRCNMPSNVSLSPHRRPAWLQPRAFGAGADRSSVGRRRGAGRPAAPKPASNLPMSSFDNASAMEQLGARALPPSPRLKERTSYSHHNMFLVRISVQPNISTFKTRLRCGNEYEIAQLVT
jgi:hypothetical protein